MKIIFITSREPDYSMLDKLENPQLYSGFWLLIDGEKGRSLAKDAKTACFEEQRLLAVVCDEEALKQHII